MSLPRLGTIGIVILGFAASVNAATFSFQGNFINDNDVQLFHFGLLTDQTVTLQTWSYGGGTDAQGNTILPGGFQVALQVFDAPTGQAMSGGFLPGSATCPPNNPDPGRANTCLDTFGQINLLAGEYIVALTQFENLSNGNLSDGFFYVDTIPDPNFNNGFATSFFQGTSAWELDLLSVDSASPQLSAVPEPGSGLLAAAALLITGIGGARGRLRSRPSANS